MISTALNPVIDGAAYLTLWLCAAVSQCEITVMDAMDNGSPADNMHQCIENARQLNAELSSAVGPNVPGTRYMKCLTRPELDRLQF